MLAVSRAEFRVASSKRHRVDFRRRCVGYFNWQKINYTLCIRNSTSLTRNSNGWITSKRLSLGNLRKTWINYIYIYIAYISWKYFVTPFICVSNLTYRFLCLSWPRGDISEHLPFSLYLSCYAGRIRVNVSPLRSRRDLPIDVENREVEEDGCDERTSEQDWTCR